MTTEPEILSLAALITRLAGPGERLNEAFTRRLATELDSASSRLELPAITALNLRDVAVTFSMDRTMTLVVAGWLVDGTGEVTVRFSERRFDEVMVALLAAPRAQAYLFCSLDFSARGQPFTLLRAVGELAVGTAVVMRALATIGGRTEARVTTPIGDRSVPVDALIAA